jgi:hypothetical protein
MLISGNAMLPAINAWGWSRRFGYAAEPAL